MYSDEAKPSERLWRTAIRLETFAGGYGFIIPGWSSNQIVTIPSKDLPSGILQAIFRGQRRFHVRVNIGAECAEELTFDEWEAT